MPSSINRQQYLLHILHTDRRRLARRQRRSVLFDIHPTVKANLFEQPHHAGEINFAFAQLAQVRFEIGPHERTYAVFEMKVIQPLFVLATNRHDIAAREVDVSGVSR